jgi:membrane protein
VLFGVEVVYAHQNIRTFVRERRLPGLSYGVREFLALSLLQEIAEAFHAGAPPRPVETLAAVLDIPARIAHELLDRLTTAGFLVPVCGEGAGYQPARELERISVADVLATLREQGGVYPIRRFTSGEEQVQQLLARLERCRTETLAGITLRDLVPGPPSPREPIGPAPSGRPPR